MRVRRAATAAALLCALCALLAAAPAAHAKVRVLTFGKTDLSGLRAQAATIRAQIDVLDRKSQEAVERYDEARADLDSSSARLIEMRRQLDLTQSRLDAARLALDERLVTMYKSDDMTLLDMLLNARDFTDVGTQLDYLRLVNRADRDKVSEVVTLTRQAGALTARLERDRVAALKQETDLQALRADVEDQLAQRQTLLAGLDGRIRKMVASQAKAAGAPAGSVDLDSINGSDAQLAVVRETMKYLGVPYVWGGATPSGGFDCSGLVMYVFAKFGVHVLHGATVQARAGTPVPFDQLEPGDLVFFGTPAFYHHVGIYIGNGNFIEAPHTGALVRVSRLAGRGANLACRYPLRLP
jgi:peptidoglycan DL-endopeptidase CwlO